MRWIALCLLAPLLMACGDQNRAVLELAGTTMGTSYSVKLVPPGESFDAEGLERDIVATLERLERSMSTYMPDSELSRLNASASTDWVQVSAELCDAIDQSLRIGRLSGGAFDITVGPVVNLWGFGPDGSVSAPPDDAAIGRALLSVGYTRLFADCTVPAVRKNDRSIYVDLSAVAKGFAVDRVAEVLEHASLGDFLVEVGGELRANGLNARSVPWSVAIETPSRATRSVQTVVPLNNAAMATSGDYRNFFEFEGRYYSHTIDPRSGRPVSHHAASVTVIAPLASNADALATALLVLGPDEGMRLAEQEQIAALFLLRAGDAVDSVASSAFSSMTRNLGS